MSKNLKWQMFSSIDNSFTPRVSKHALKHDSNGYGARIFSYKAKNNLKDTAKDFANFIKENYKIKLVKDIKEEHVFAYLNFKKSTCSDKSLQQYQSRLKKIGICCSEYFGVRVNFESKLPHKTIKNNDIRTIAMDRKDFEKVIQNSRNCESLLAIKLVGAFGLRVSEAVKIRACDIDLNKKTLFIYQSKGGRDRTLSIDNQEKMNIAKELYQLGLKEPDKRILSVKEDSVNRFLSNNLNRLGITKYSEHKTGCHAIRKMYATKKYQELRSMGWNHKKAWGVVSVELGHSANREDLFYTYVK